MYTFAILLTLLVAAAAEPCYDDVEGTCSISSQNTDRPLLADCNAKYGAIEALEPDLQAYAYSNIETSFEYLMMSTHFGNYEANREGLKKLYRKLSDRAWEDAIDTIKFITRRGGKMDFNQLPRSTKTSKPKTVQLNELNSLARALDKQKQLATEAMRIHTQARHHAKGDGSVAHFIEEKFFNQQSERIRSLAGHTTDLKNLLRESVAPISVWLFDENLKKL